MIFFTRVQPVCGAQSYVICTRACGCVHAGVYAYVCNEELRCSFGCGVLYVVMVCCEWQGRCDNEYGGMGALLASIEPVKHVLKQEEEVVVLLL